MRALGLAAVAVTLACSACGGPAMAPARSVSLRMRGGPPQATVTIDDVMVGPLNVVTARGIAVRPGSHRISIEALGYLPWDKIVDAKDAPVVLEVSLVPVPD